MKQQILTEMSLYPDSWDDMALEDLIENLQKIKNENKEKLFIKRENVFDAHDDDNYYSYTFYYLKTT